MALYKDKRYNTYYISVHDENGRRIRQSTGTANKEEAELIHDEVVRNIRLAKFGLALPVVVEPEIPQVQLSIYAKKYDEYMKAKFQPKTAEACRSAFASLTRFFPSQIQFFQILQSAKSKNGKSGCSPHQSLRHWIFISVP